MTTAHKTDASTPVVPLHLAFELGWTEWKLAFTIGHGQAARLRTIKARDPQVLLVEIAKAKRRFQLPDDAPVVSCYEAGRDGFWLHRWLAANGIQNVVVDSASIEVNRRKRRAKTDRLDAAKLVTMLLRYHAGERKVWSVVRVPQESDEDARQLHRELLELKDERTEHVNRIKGLLASQGLAAAVTEDFPARLELLRRWDDLPVPTELRQRLLREFERWRFLHRQILDLEKERRQRIRRQASPQVEKVRTLLTLRGIGLNGAWLSVFELFGWRDIRNRRELAGLAGLTPTPYNSGDDTREQGISKAGNKRLRRMLVELAWGWLRWQPDSALSQWYEARFGQGGRRARKVGIVALARKLLIALWRYLEYGEIPRGAKLCDWRTKVTRPEGSAA